MKQYTTLLLVLICMVACSSSTTKIASFDKEQEIVFKEIESNEIIAYSLQLEKYKNSLLVNDWREDSIIHIFDLSSKRFLYNIAAIGNGPKELSNPTLIQVEKDMLYLYEISKFRMHVLPLDSIAHESEAMTMLFQTPSETQRVYALSDSLFVSTGIAYPRFTLLNREGNKVAAFGEYPDLWEQEQDFPVSAKAMFHQAFFVKHPSLPLFAFVSSQVLEIYSYSTTKPYEPKLEHQILLNNYNYSYKTGDYISAEAGNGVARGVKDVDRSSKYIYAVYNLSSQQTPNLGYQVMVFNWQGKAIMAYNTEEELSRICIDEQEKRAYCTILNPQNTQDGLNRDCISEQEYRAQYTKLIPEESIVYFDL